MWHAIASELKMTIAEAQERIDSAEFTDWYVYHRCLPIGVEGAYLRAGIGAAANFNVWARRNQRVAPSDLIPTFKKAKRFMTDDEMLQAAKLWSGAV